MVCSSRINQKLREKYPKLQTKRCDLFTLCNEYYGSAALLMIILFVERSEAFFLTSFSSSSRCQNFPHRLCNVRNGRLEYCFKRLRTDPPKGLKAMEPEAVAESIETILKEQGKDNFPEAFIGSMDAWMVAFNKEKSKEKEGGSTNITIKYGKRMEGVLNLMEKNCVDGTTVDAYASVIHLYLSGRESYAAQRVLGRMENQLVLQQQQRQQKSDGTSNDDEFQNIKRRLIQYNRVLQGLVSSPADPSHLEAAFHLLTSMCLEEEFSHPGLVPFLPKNVKPDAKSFAIVIESMLKEEGGDKTDAPLVFLLKQARKFNQLDGFLMKKMDQAVPDSNKERLVALLKRSF